MRFAGLCSLSLAFLFSAPLNTVALAQAEVAEPALPEYRDEDLQLTEKKIEVLDEEMEKLAGLTQVLQELGSPSKKDPGESTRVYLERVDSTMKARGMAVHLLHQQLERALEAKVQLEAQIDEYEDWVEAIGRQLDAYPKQYQARAESLDQEVLELRRDGMILAFLLHKEASKRRDEEAIKDYASQFIADDGGNLLDTLADREARQEKFEERPEDELTSLYQDVASQVLDKSFERDLLTSHVILETEELSEILPAEHRQMVRQARDVLEQSKDLEDRSSQVSVIARYVFDNLQLVSPYSDAIRRMIVIRQKVVPGLPKIDEAIDQLVGGELPNRGRRGLMRVEPLE